MVSFADQIRQSSGSAELHIWHGGLSRLRHARTGPAAIPRCSSRATGLAASHTRPPVRGVSGADMQRPTTAPAPAVVGSWQARRGLFLGPLRRLGRCIVVPTGGSRGRFAAAARCARSGSRAAGSMRSSVQANGSLKIAMLAGTVGPPSACGGAAAILLGQPDVEHPSRPRPPAGPRDFCNRVDGGLPGGIGQSAGARPGGPCADSMVPRWLYRSPVAVLAICPQTSRALSDVARSSRRCGTFSSARGWSR